MCLALALGVMATVLTAWACALWIDVQTDGAWVGASRTDVLYWWIQRADSRGKVWFESYFAPNAATDGTAPNVPRAEEVAPAWFDPRVAQMRHPNEKIDSHIEIFASGWPRPALAVERPIDGSFVPAARVAPARRRWTDGFHWNDDAPLENRLPLIPIWRNLLFDALFFGSVWFFLLTLLYTLRRANRIRRGRCPECSYDLRKKFAGGCPECGWNRGEAKD